MAARRPRLQIKPNIKSTPKSGPTPIPKAKSIQAESSFSEAKSPSKVPECDNAVTGKCNTLVSATHEAGDTNCTIMKSSRETAECLSDCSVAENKHEEEKISSGDRGDGASNHRRSRLNVKPNIRPTVKAESLSTPKTAATDSNKLPSPVKTAEPQLSSSETHVEPEKVMVSKIKSPRKSVGECDHSTSPLCQKETKSTSVKSPRNSVESLPPESIASEKIKEDQVPSSHSRKDTFSQRRPRVNIQPNIRPSVKTGSASTLKTNPTQAVTTANETRSPVKASQSENSSDDKCVAPDMVSGDVSEQRNETRVMKSPRQSEVSIDDSPVLEKNQEPNKNTLSSSEESKSSQRRPRFNIKPNIRPSGKTGSPATSKLKSAAKSKVEKANSERHDIVLINDGESVPAVAEKDGASVPISLDTPPSEDNSENPTDTNDYSKLTDDHLQSTTLISPVAPSSPPSPAAAPNEVVVPPLLRETLTPTPCSKGTDLEDVVSVASGEAQDAASCVSEALSLEAAEERTKDLEEEAPVEKKKIVRRKRKQLSPSVTSSLSPDRQKMKMGDLVFWNPQHNFFPKKNKPLVKKEEIKVKVPEPEPDDLKDDSTNESSSLPAPQIMIGPDGNIMLNTESLIIRNEKKEAVDPKDIIEEDAEDRYLNYATYRKTKKAARWTEKESNMFFLGLSMCGTDFSLLTRLMPHRSRRDLKNKFRREEKGNRHSVDRALATRKKYDPEPFLNIEEKIKEKPKPKPEKKPRPPKVKKEVKTVKKEGAEIKPEKKKRQRKKKIKKKEPESEIEDENMWISGGEDSAPEASVELPTKIDLNGPKVKTEAAGGVTKIEDVESDSSPKQKQRPKRTRRLKVKKDYHESSDYEGTSDNPVTVEETAPDTNRDSSIQAIPGSTQIQIDMGDRVMQGVLIPPSMVPILAPQLGIDSVTEGMQVVLVQEECPTGSLVHVYIIPEGEGNILHNPDGTSSNIGILPNQQQPEHVEPPSSQPDDISTMALKSSQPQDVLQTSFKSSQPDDIPPMSFKSSQAKDMLQSPVKSSQPDTGSPVRCSSPSNGNNVFPGDQEPPREGTSLSDTVQPNTCQDQNTTPSSHTESDPGNLLLSPGTSQSSNTESNVLTSPSNVYPNSTPINADTVTSPHSSQTPLCASDSVSSQSPQGSYS